MKMMSVSMLCGCMLCGCVLCAVVAFADEKPAAPTTTPAAAPTTEPTVNKNCAVNTDEAVDPTVFVYYKGQKIGFCCSMCVKKFNADPEKYVKNMK